MNGIAVIAMISVSAASGAELSEFQEANNAFIQDLNRHTAEASRVILFGELVVVNPKKMGPEVRVQVRGGMVDFGGISLPMANYVIVGQQCEPCWHKTTRYRVGNGWENIIVVYDD